MVLLASRACVSLTACHTPAAFIAAHQGLTFAWLVRVMAQTTKLGALAMQSPGDAMARFTARLPLDAWAVPDPGTDPPAARGRSAAPATTRPGGDLRRSNLQPGATLSSWSLPQLDNRAGGSADLIRNLGLAYHLVDCVGDLPRHRVVDHVPGVGNQD